LTFCGGGGTQANINTGRLRSPVIKSILISFIWKLLLYIILTLNKESFYYYYYLVSNQLDLVTFQPTRHWKLYVTALMKLRPCLFLCFVKFYPHILSTKYSLTYIKPRTISPGLMHFCKYFLYGLILHRKAHYIGKIIYGGLISRIFTVCWWCKFKSVGKFAIFHYIYYIVYKLVLSICL